ncbi:MAG: response regulator transcription factor [Tannerellaceae bacterium]|jgi:DNA-binding response OmpR family regulator|nr:response regulator transcription factor [Tannerellaceae bacterium]
MNGKILVVDDDYDASELLAFNLVNEGFEVQCVSSAKEALEDLGPEHVLILLDVMMEGMSGYRMAETLRRNGNEVPIIFLTAKDGENDMLTGFSVGADDYIAKPFSMKEVIARVRAVLRRRIIHTPSQKKDRKLVFKDIVIDLDKKELILADEEIVLTKTEFEILTTLAENPERIFSRENIISKVWSETPYITERTVDVHITRLRKKLGEHASLITNRAGYGYRFILPEDT